MLKDNRKFILDRFAPYMGKRRVLLPISLVLSGLSAVLNIVPFIIVWYITRELLSASKSMNISNISLYAWIAFGSAAGGIAVYFLALLSSHLAAFRVEVGMQSRNGKNTFHAAWFL